MKKTYYTLLVLCAVFLFGCSSKSDDNDPDAPKAIDKTANLKSTGESANDLLSGETFKKIKIEIAYVEGFEPTAEALGRFKTFLINRTFKEVVDFEFTQLESPGEETLTLEEIADLEEKNRTLFNEGDTMGVYIYFADAPAEGDDLEEGLVTLGAVYRNTSMIIHEVTVRKLADQSIFISDSDVENSTLNHEFGHLFGLVNLGTAMVNDHEDVKVDENGVPVSDGNGGFEGNNHCSVESCLMRAELQFGGSSGKSASRYSKNSKALEVACRLNGKGLLKMLEKRASKGPLVDPPPLDSECLLDLAANGGR